MRNPVETFERLLDRFRFRDPVADSVQRLILARKRDALVLTLKAVDDYSAVYGLVLRVYLGSRRAGLRLSMRASRVVLAVFIFITLLFSATLAYSIYAIIGNEIRQSGITESIRGHDTVVPGVRDTEKKDLNKQPDEKNMNDAKVHPAGACQLGVSTFSGEAGSDDDSRRVTNMIADRLIGIKGPDKVIRLDNRKGRVAPRILMGSVDRLGNSVIISSRIVDAEKGTIVFSTSENVNSPDEIARACATIAERVASHIR
jgi:hypothetical protein